jgi:hypothetical protein
MHQNAWIIRPQPLIAPVSAVRIDPVSAANSKHLDRPRWHVQGLLAGSQAYPGFACPYQFEDFPHDLKVSLRGNSVWRPASKNDTCHYWHNSKRMWTWWFALV